MRKAFSDPSTLDLPGEQIRHLPGSTAVLSELWGLGATYCVACFPEKPILLLPVLHFHLAHACDQELALTCSDS